MNNTSISENNTSPSLYTPLKQPQTNPIFPFIQRDMIFAVCFAVLCIFWTDAAFWSDWNAGFALTTALMIILSLFYLRKKPIKVGFFPVFCTVGALSALPVFAIYDDYFSKFWLFLAVIALTAAAWTVFSGTDHHGTDSFRFLYDIFYTIIPRPFSRCGITVKSLWAASSDGKKRQRIGVLIGIVCAIPVLVVLFPLLMSSDAAFEGLIDHLSLRPGRILFCVLFGIGLFLLLFALLFSLLKEASIRKEENKTFSGCLGAAPVSAFLSVIALLYLLYLFSQLAYFVGGFSGILPEDFTLSEYARRGFFEMCAICALNLFIGFFSVLLVKKSDKKAPIAVRILFVFFCAFSLLLIGCALGKMILYVRLLGMTRLRICTSVFMIMLAFVFIFAIIRNFCPSFPYMKAIILVVTLLGLITAWTDIDTTVARYNTEAYFSGKLDSIDAFTISELSDSSVPYQIQLVQSADDPAVKSEIRSSLAWRFITYYTKNEDGSFSANPTSLSSFNLAQTRARKLLYENRDLYMKEIREYTDYDEMD